MRLEEIFANQHPLEALDVAIAQSGRLPESLALYQNYPNPFNQETVIRYTLPQAGAVSLCLYNQNGRLVNPIFQGNQDRGEHRIVWDGTGESGKLLPSGIYIYELKTGSGDRSGKMSLIR